MWNGRKIMSWGIKVVFKISLVGGSVLMKKNITNKLKLKYLALLALSNGETKRNL